MDWKLSRRGLLRASAGAVAMAAAGCTNTTSSACSDPDSLTDEEIALRTSVGYRDRSTDKNQICGGCAFFKPSDSSCGSCSILNGLVNRSGHCASWAVPSR